MLQTFTRSTRDYWAAARAELKNVRVLAFAGILCAMAVLLKSFPIYLAGPSLKITFVFLAASLGAYCYGPVVGMLVGAATDFLGFMIAGAGEPYFPGYLLTAILSGLLYGLLLYRRRPGVARLVVTRLVINYGINVLLGSVWKAMLYGKGYYYYLTTGLVKNTVLLPVEVALTWLVLGAAVRYGLNERYLHPKKLIS